MGGWSGYGDKKAGSNLGYVEENGVKVFLFSEAPARVRFLTEDVKAEDIMASMGLVREAAEDYILTKLIHEKWIMPKSYWEHKINAIPGKRYYSTAACAGKNRCQMCMENDAARESGVSENKFLPYPVSKKFIVPAYFYDLKAVLFVRGNQQFFDGIAKYIDKSGSVVDFEIYKKGLKLQTTYESTFLGPSLEALPEGLQYPKPSEVDLVPSPEALAAAIEGSPPPRQGGQQRPASGASAGVGVDFKAAAAASKAEQAPPKQEAPKDEGPGTFALPFGTHKGLTIKQVFDLGEVDYLKFIAEQSSGLVQEKVKAFLDLQAGK
jgi:hypothetical protein